MAQNSPSPEAAVGWTEARMRRARWFAVTLVVGCLIVFATAFMPWFAWATPGLTPSCEPAPRTAATQKVTIDRQGSTTIAARGCITGVGLVAQQLSTDEDGSRATQAQSRARGFSIAPRNMIGVGGMPRANVALAGAAAMAAVAALMRKGWVAVIAGPVWLTGYRDLSAALTHFTTGGTELMPAWKVLSFGATVIPWLVLACAIFVLKVNFDERKAARAKASAEGREGPKEPLDLVTDYLGRKIAKVQDAAEQNRTQSATVGS